MTRLQLLPADLRWRRRRAVLRGLRARGGLDAGVWIAAQAMTTDGNSSFDESDMRKLVGYDMTRRAAQQVYEAAGIGPEDVPVAELHDCFTTNELLTTGAGLRARGRR